MPEEKKKDGPMLAAMKYAEAIIREGERGGLTREQAVISMRAAGDEIAAVIRGGQPGTVEKREQGYQDDWWNPPK